MSKDIEKIDEIFRMTEENENKAENELEVIEEAAVYDEFIGEAEADILDDFIEGEELEISDESDEQDMEKEPDEISETVAEDEAQKKTAKNKTSRLKAVDNLLIDKQGDQPSNYTGDVPSERDYSPVRQSHEYKSGCLGGVMYFVFVVCVSVVLACFIWMAVSDALALNKEDISAVVSLPNTAFVSETVDTFDENGKKTGTKRVTHADIDFVSTELKEAGIIQYKWLFEFFCQISEADLKIDPGNYELKSSFDYRALIQNMQAGSGATVTIDVTIPEGFSMHDIFVRLEENNVCSYDELMEAAATYTYNYDFVPEYVEGSGRLEGIMFPDTYQFYVGMQASSAINKFLETFHYKITADMLKRLTELDTDMYSIVNIASLIEKEAANDEERALIASVIYNRLNADMPLGIDASILYEYPGHEGAPTAEMLTADSPYNTRIHTGLPPTPICNPGMASINAALNPQQTNYYYYALDTETGTHRFFRYVDEFNAFVATQNYG